MKTRIAVLFGGRSVEHEVSIISGIQAIMNMDAEKYDIIPVYLTKNNEMYVGNDIGNIDLYKDIKSLLERSQHIVMIKEDDAVYLVDYPIKKFGKNNKISIDMVFPIVHGTNVEDGALQGFLKTLGIPFVGCDVTASAVGMDKYVTKTILKDNDIPVLDCLCYVTSDYAEIDSMMEEIEKKIGYPAIIKPVNLGSSVGIAVVKNKLELEKAIDDAFLYSRKILVEHAVSNLREINCAVLGDDNDAVASECEEPMHTADILSYEDKYMSNGSKSGASKGMASVSRKIPARLSPELREEVRNMAVKAFKKLGCHGVARIDFIIDEDSNKLYFNEINTIPGSLSFYLWEPIGIQYSELLDKMIQLAMKRVREESSIVYSFNSNILNMQVLGGAKGGNYDKKSNTSYRRSEGNI